MSIQSAINDAVLSNMNDIREDVNTIHKNMKEIVDVIKNLNKKVNDLRKDVEELKLQKEVSLQSEEVSYLKKNKSRTLFTTITRPEDEYSKIFEYKLMYQFHTVTWEMYDKDLLSKCFVFFISHIEPKYIRADGWKISVDYDLRFSTKETTEDDNYSVLEKLGLDVRQNTVSEKGVQYTMFTDINSDILNIVSPEERVLLESIS